MDANHSEPYICRPDFNALWINNVPFENIWEKSGLRMQFSGAMSPTDVLNANLGFYGDHRSDSARYQIIDTLDVTGLGGDMESYASIMETLAAMDSASAFSLGKLLVVLVSTSDQIMELFESYAGISAEIQSDLHTAIFRDLASARAWIASNGLVGV